MNALLATAILTLLAPPRTAVTGAPATVAPVTVNVNAKNGESITGERTFRVTVQAENAVTGVEFYVGTDLRDKDTSTPYEFTVDSLSETDGDLKLRFKAYTTEGESGEKSVTVHIDNQLDKGLPFHVTAGTEALQNGKFDDAITSGRIALRIDPKSVAARLIVARGYLGKSAYDKAQKYAEDAVADDPGNSAAADLLSGIKLKQAFSTTASGDRKDALNTIRDAMKSAVETHRKTVDMNLDKQGNPTDANLLSYADAALAAERYSLVISDLQPAFLKDNRKPDVANRLAYAMSRLGRYREALETLTTLKKYGQLDTFSDALLAVVYAELGDADSSDAALKDALVSNGDDPVVLSAQAYVALKFIRHKVLDRTTLLLNYDNVSGQDATARAESARVMRNSLDQLQKNQSSSSEVNFYAAALNNKLEEFNRAEHQFEQAVLTDPLNVDAFVEQGNRSIGATFNGKPTADQTDQALGMARVYYEAALAARPDSPQALCGLSLVSSMERKWDEAVKWGEAAVKAGPSFAASQVVLGTAYFGASGNLRAQADVIRNQNKTGGTTNEERQTNELKARDMEAKAAEFARKARDVAAQSSQLDARLQGMDLRNTLPTFRYFYTGGRIPLLPLPH